MHAALVCDTPRALHCSRLCVDILLAGLSAADKAERIPPLACSRCFVSPATDTNGLPSEPADLSALPMALHRPIPSDHAVKQQQLDLLHRALPKPSSSPRPDTGVSTVNVCCCLPEQEAASQRERETERERRNFNLFQRPRADELRVTYGSFAPGQ